MNIHIRKSRKYRKYRKSKNKTIYRFNRKYTKKRSYFKGGQNIKNIKKRILKLAGGADKELKQIYGEIEKAAMGKSETPYILFKAALIIIDNFSHNPDGEAAFQKIMEEKIGSSEQDNINYEKETLNSLKDKPPFFDKNEVLAIKKRLDKKKKNIGTNMPTDAVLQRSLSLEKSLETSLETLSEDNANEYFSYFLETLGESKENAEEYFSALLGVIENENLQKAYIKYLYESWRTASSIEGYNIISPSVKLQACLYSKDIYLPLKEDKIYIPKSNAQITNALAPSSAAATQTSVTHPAVTLKEDSGKGIYDAILSYFNKHIPELNFVNQPNKTSICELIVEEFIEIMNESIKYNQDYSTMKNMALPTYEEMIKLYAQDNITRNEIKKIFNLFNNQVGIKLKLEDNTDASPSKEEPMGIINYMFSVNNCLKGQLQELIKRLPGLPGLPTLKTPKELLASLVVFPTKETLLKKITEKYKQYEQ